MSKLIVGSAVTALALGLMASPGLAAETIQQKLEQGSSGGVGYSYLTTGTSDNGSGADNVWSLSGTFSVVWDNGDITDGSGTIDIYSGTNKIGELDIHLIESDGSVSAGTSISNSSQFATVCFSLTGGFGSSTFDNLLDDDGADIANGDYTTDKINVGFLNYEYKANSGFNSIGKDTNGDFTMSLWGNEDQNNGGWGGTGENNWGLDWKSVPVPLPSPLLLGLAGLGMVWVRKRRGN